VPLAAQHILCLGSAEIICCKLRAAHMIEDFLTLLQAFAAVNTRLFQAIVQTPVTVVLENGIVYWLDDPSILGGICQLDIVVPELIP
jgi:hypothetical protein